MINVAVLNKIAYFVDFIILQEKILNPFSQNKILNQL